VSTKQPVSLIDQMLERNKPKPADPVCPLCSTAEQPVALLQQDLKGWRCPQCHLAFINPVPKPGAMPDIQACKRCKRKGRIQYMVRLDWMKQWCPECNLTLTVLTDEQQAAREASTRLVVGGCYGGPPPRKALKGGGSKNGRVRKDAKKGKRFVAVDQLGCSWKPRRVDGQATRKGKN
jgi:hypothetical protein